MKISTSTRLMVTTPGRFHPMITWSHEILMTAKLDKVEVYSKEPPPLSLLTLWSRDQVITRQMKNVISQLSGDLWLQNLTEWWVLMHAYYPSSHSTYWSRGHIRSHDKWKMFQIHFHVICRYQSWQNGGLWLGVTCPTTKPHMPSITYSFG